MHYKARRQLGALLGAMVRHGVLLGTLAGAAAHFVRVSRSYWPGLFCCYEVAGLPRTNNDLEQFFGSHRYHERRASGRKGSSPCLVLRGQARLLAAASTRRRAFSVVELAQADRSRCEELRRQLEARRQRRVQRRRFRRGPKAYLQALEQQLLQAVHFTENCTRVPRIAILGTSLRRPCCRCCGPARLPRVPELEPRTQSLSLSRPAGENRTMAGSFPDFEALARRLATDWPGRAKGERRLGPKGGLRGPAPIDSRRGRCGGLPL